jgi:hypothetical protein
VSYVKTADLRGRLPERDAQGNARWAFCATCYGNKLNDQGDTTDADGAVCPGCDGTGTVWIVRDQGS